jgi:A/G-specific adenine glycosylase
MNPAGEALNSDQLKVFRKSLLDWFRTYQRDLPWRTNRDPYRIWISEIMLQQTRVAAVIPYYERFLQRFPDVQRLAEGPHEEILRLWSGLGYYTRARNLQHAAQQIMAKHTGEFPRKREDALGLPGIGEYTAAAILSIAFDQPLAVLDGNVARVIARLDAVRGDLRAPQRWRGLQNRAGTLLVRESAGDWNQAMMEVGATVCTPKSPQCLLCPVSQWCEGRKLGIAESLPDKRKKRPAVAVQLVSAVLLNRSGKCLLLPPPVGSTRSNADGHIPSLVAKLWHFPTSAMTSRPERLLAHFVRETLKVQARNVLQTETLPKVRHTVTYRQITVSPYLVTVKTLPRIRGAKQVSLEQVLALPISNLTRKVARVAAKHLSLCALNVKNNRN